MITNLRFAHKIMLATSLVVSIAFAAFASFNSYLQKESIRSSLEASLTEVGRLTAENISYWLDARVKLVDAAVQSCMVASVHNIGELEAPATQDDFKAFRDQGVIRSVPVPCASQQIPQAELHGKSGLAKSLV